MGTIQKRKHPARKTGPRTPDRRRSNVATAGLVVLTATVAIATPHLVDDHLFSLSTTATQSLVIGLDFALASLFYGFYRRQLRRSEAQNQVVQARLASSFRYIGEANGSLDLMETFINGLSEVRTQRDARELLSLLHKTISVTVAKASASRIRLIEQDRGRTVTEFEWDDGQGGPPPSISNRGVLADSEHKNAERSAVVRSNYASGATQCVIALVWKDGDATNLKLIKTLITQFHLLLIVMLDHHPGIRSLAELAGEPEVLRQAAAIP